MAGVSPNTYDKNLSDKRKEPQYTMGAKLTDIDKRVGPSPQQYNIPSKMVEKQGKTIGSKLKGALDVQDKS